MNLLIPKSLSTKIVRDLCTIRDTLIRTRMISFLLRDKMNK